MSIDSKLIAKSTWISLAEDYYNKLSSTLQQIQIQDWRKTSPYLGWNSLEVLAHMASSNTINFQFLVDLALTGKPVPKPPFDFFLRNAEAVEKLKGNSIEKLLEEFRFTLETNMNCYKNLSESDWHKPAWFFIGDVDIRTLFLVQLSDTLVHERDILFPSGNWKEYNSDIFAPLVDWFMCEFRPAAFRKESAEGMDISVQYQLNGAGGGY